jgi:hypothetical protein
MQTLDEKVDAIVSLLGFMLYHLDQAPGAVATARQEWISEPSSLDPPKSPPRAINVFCDGRCSRCLNVLKANGKKPNCPPDEAWARTRDALRRRYRMNDIEQALYALSACGMSGAIAAQAVWAEHVEPPVDPRSEAICPEARTYREVMAQVGVRWMAEWIPGDVIGFGVEAPTKQQQATSLIADGIRSPSVIAQRLGCSVRHAKRLKAAVAVQS